MDVQIIASQIISLILYTCTKSKELNKMTITEFFGPAHPNTEASTPKPLKRD